MRSEAYSKLPTLAKKYVRMSKANRTRFMATLSPDQQGLLNQEVGDYFTSEASAKKVSTRKETKKTSDPFKSSSSKKSDW